MVKISILLAACNGEKYLPEQLASISAQTVPGFEVIYQDDGSEDDTADILEKWRISDPRFRPGSRQGQHLGAVGNFFSLLTQAEGDLILFCDQDDIWEADKISVLTQACLREKPDLSKPVLVHSDAAVISEEGAELAPSFFRLEGWDARAVHLPQLLVQNNVTGCMMLITRPLADLVIRYGNPQKMFMHDWFIALTAASFGKIVFVPERLTRYRQHAGNAIGASRSSLFRRGFQAIKDQDRARARIELTYSHTQSFLDAFGDMLPAEARRTVENYLATRTMPKLQRVSALRRQGFLMQSPVTRIGQLFFG